jgi:hypothetical protein
MASDNLRGTVARCAVTKSGRRRDHRHRPNPEDDDSETVSEEPSFTPLQMITRAPVGPALSHWNAQCNSRSIRDENVASVDCCAVIRASGDCRALGAMTESDLAVREATYRNRADALSRV